MGEQKCYKLTAGFWTYLKPVAIFDTLHAKLHDIRTPLKLRNTMFGIINSVWITAIFKYKQADGEDKSVYGSRFFRANGAMKLKFFRPNKHLCCHKFRSVAIWILGNTIQSEVSQSIITFRLRKKASPGPTLCWSWNYASEIRDTAQVYWTLNQWVTFVGSRTL